VEPHREDTRLDRRIGRGQSLGLGECGHVEDEDPAHARIVVLPTETEGAYYEQYALVDLFLDPAQLPLLDRRALRVARLPAPFTGDQRDEYEGLSHRPFGARRASACDEARGKGGDSEV
jgi:hypothetical protein